MVLNGFFQVFFAGCFGGLIAESIKWYRLRENKRLPRYAATVRYWTITAMMIGGGGVLTTLYGVDAVNGILAVNIGVSAPLIIASFAATVPATPRTRGREPQRPAVLDVLAGR